MENIAAFDLNLLRVFDAVYRCRSVGRAADELGIAQPTASNALRRLRSQLGDRLFVRVGNELVPTALADAVAKNVGAALAHVGEALALPARFAPETSERCFVIAMTDIAEAVILPRLLEASRRVAPGVSYRTRHVPSASIEAALADRELDLAIGFAPDVAGAIMQQKLFATDYVCIARAGSGDPIDTDAFAAARHVVVEATGTGHDLARRAVVGAAGPRAVGASVPNFLSLAFVVAASDLLATVPRPLAVVMRGRVGLEIHPHPLPLPAIEVRQFWHPRMDNEAANRWLRGLIAEVTRSIGVLQKR